MLSMRLSGKWTAILAVALASSTVGCAAEIEEGGAPTPLQVTAGKSLVLDSPLNIQRVSIAAGEMAEAVAVNPREVLINGKLPGETSLIIWQQGGPRLVFDLTIKPNGTKLEVVRDQIAKEMPGQDVTITVSGTDVYLRGTVKSLINAERAANLAGTVGLRVINLLHVTVPKEEAQVLLKVKFADIDRSVSSQLGFNMFSTGATRTIGGITTQQYSPAQLQTSQTANGQQTVFTLQNALNLFLFRPDLNLGATIEALQAKNLLQILAEPNVLAMNGKEASFVAGGEFPVPVVQGGANVGAVTIQFREYGVRIHFLPTITPRGTIRLRVTPEVSSLDYNNGVVLQGFTVPALATRRVETEIELETGQSFAIAGLLDNRFTETLDKIPGIGDIPLLGKLFQSRTKNKNNSELLVMVTPELVRPIPAGDPVPALQMIKPPMDGSLKDAPRTPGIETTGPVPVKPERESMPVEELLDIARKEQGPVAGNAAPPATSPSAPPTAAPVGAPGGQPAAPSTPPTGNGQ